MMKINKPSSFNKIQYEKLYAVIIILICILIIIRIMISMSNVFGETFVYISKKFVAEVLPVVYYDGSNSLSARINNEIIPAMAVYDEDDIDDSYYNFYDDALLADGSGYNQTGVQGGTQSDNTTVENVTEGTDVETAGNEAGDTTVNSEEVIQTDTSTASGDSTVPVINYQGVTYSTEQLYSYDFLVGNIFAVDSSASVTTDEINGENLLNMDLSVDLSGEDYKVLIYHTHASEAFADSAEGVESDTIVGVGDELTRILEEDYGIKVYHDRTAYDIVNGELDRSYAYNQAAEGIDKILAENPSIEVVIDLHRDGVREDIHLVTMVDGEPTAQIMFLNGISRSKANGDIERLYNPYKKENLAFSLQMYLEGKHICSDFVRKIYVKSYRYNLEKKPRSTLIEVGAQTNTVQEAKNAMKPLAAILYKVLSGEN